MAKGLSNREICGLLEISQNTVKIHVAAVLRALDVSNRTEAVFAYKGIVENPTQDQEQPVNRMRLADRLGRPTIAVVPFQDLTEGKSQSHVLEGVVDELLVRLSSWRWFPIIAFASSRRFDPIENDPQTIGSQLGADYLIYGSLRLTKEKVRVTVRLVKSDSAQEVWNRSFDVAATDLFELQEQVATQMVRVMAPEFVSAEIAHLPQVLSPSSSAWDCVCLGLYNMNLYTQESVVQAQTFFTQALEAAPEYSLAWHGKITALEIEVFEQWASDPGASIEKICQSAQANFRANPNDALALTDMGLAAIFLGQQDQAIGYLEHAVSINPSSVRALMLLAQALGMRGDLDDCILYLEELLKLDPYSRASARYQSIIASCHVSAGRAEEGVRWAKEALNADPNATGAYMTLVAGYVDMEDMEAAQTWVEKLRQAAPDFDTAHRLRLMQPLTNPENFQILSERLARAGLEVPS